MKLKIVTCAKCKHFGYWKVQTDPVFKILYLLNLIIYSLKIGLVVSIVRRGKILERHQLPKFSKLLPA